jgi:hypothetical protein
VIYLDCYDVYIDSYDVYIDDVYLSLYIKKIYSANLTFSILLILQWKISVICNAKKEVTTLVSSST